MSVVEAPDGDRAWQLASARGEITTEAALLQVRVMHDTRDHWAARDPELAQALADGDAAHADDDRRWGAAADFPPPELDVDPATMAAFEMLAEQRQRDVSPVRLTPAASVRIDRPYWVWDRRIPVGGTTLMPGREGLGKTALVCWLMARLTRGQLEGQWHKRPAHVVYVGNEDDRSSVLVPRLTAAGADLDRVHFVDMPDGASFSVGVDSVSLAQAVTGLDVALVVVDPLDGHLAGVDTHRKAEVQQSVAKLAQFAQDVRCGALGLAHLNKGDTRDLLSRVVGSVGFTTSVRSVLGVGEHPDDPTERICVVGKANMTDKSTVPALRFRVEGTLIEHPDGGTPIDTGVAVILGEEEGIDPNAVIDGGSPAERTARDEAAAWLADVLDEGPMPRAEVVKLARAEGISLATLKRAMQAVGVDVTRSHSERGRPSVWALKSYGSPHVEPKPPEPKPEPPLTSGNGSVSRITAHTSDTEPKYGSRPLDDVRAQAFDRDEEW